MGILPVASVKIIRDSRFPTPHSPLPTPDSRLPIPHLPTPHP
ncbi:MULTISPECIES: hypothetical protein [unclassified Moorena]|nr:MULTISPECIES: hypothetical protein [unclassified Moorena]